MSGFDSVLWLTVSLPQWGQREDSFMINVMAKLKIYFYPQTKIKKRQRKWGGSRRMVWFMLCQKSWGVMLMLMLMVMGSAQHKNIRHRSQAWRLVWSAVEAWLFRGSVCLRSRQRKWSSVWCILGNNLYCTWLTIVQNIQEWIQLHNGH